MSTPAKTSLKVTPAMLERFMSKVDMSGDCHMWMAYRGSGGYGRFRANGTMWLAHRVSYIIANGEIPQDLELDHLCRNRACVNPGHLEAVTKRLNQLRSPLSIITRNAERNECARGHSDWIKPKPGRRTKTCRVCLNDAQRRRYYERKASA